MKKIIEYIISRIPNHASIEFLEDAEFEQRVNAEVARLAEHRAGVLFIEARTMTEHLREQEIPDAKDLIELRAITLHLLDNYDCAILEPWRDMKTHKEVFSAFKETFFSDDPDLCWMRHIMKAAIQYHLNEMEENTLQWLIEWKPYDLRLHNAKIEFLAKARISTLSQMLSVLIHRELDLLDHHAAVKEAPDYEHEKLWQSVTDTRQMRLAVEGYWGKHPRIPVDYAEQMLGKDPHDQLAFLEEKKQRIKKICDADLAEIKEQKNPTAKKQDSFSLYAE